MVKHILALIAGSFIAVLIKSQVDRILHGILAFHDMIEKCLGIIFSHGYWGQLIQASLALFIPPLLMSGVIALVYWLLKRDRWKHMMPFVWVSWLLLMASFALR